MFFPAHLHFKFSFLQLSSASCDPSGNTQEINCGRLLSNRAILHNTTAQEEPGHGQDAFLARLPTAGLVLLQYSQFPGLAGSSSSRWDLWEIQNLCSVHRIPSQLLRNSRCAWQNKQLPSVMLSVSPVKSGHSAPSLWGGCRILLHSTGVGIINNQIFTEITKIRTHKPQTSCTGCTEGKLCICTVDIQIRPKNQVIFKWRVWIQIRAALSWLNRALLNWGEPQVPGGLEMNRAQVLGALAAPAPPEHILCSCSPSEPVRGSSTPCLHPIRSVVNCLPTQPHHRQTRLLKVIPQWSPRSCFKRSSVFTAWPKDHSPRLFAVSHHRAVLKPPEQQGTRGQRPLPPVTSQFIPWQILSGVWVRTQNSTTFGWCLGGKWLLHLQPMLSHWKLHFDGEYQGSEIFRWPSVC